jgi:Ca-activated chloride channel family protein
MRGGLLVVFVALAAAGGLVAAESGQPPQQQQQPPKIRSGIELVSLNVSVTDAGKYVTDLEQKDFEVFEDGARQAISFFSRKQQPIALSILLDTSNSMEDKLKTAQEAAIGFVRRLKPDDVASVIDFNSQVRIIQDFTGDMDVLDRAIRSTQANGSTSLYNALYVSLKELRKVPVRSEDEIRRQAVVVLSDGDDTSSLMPYEEVLDLAKRSETAVYTIGLRPPANETIRGGFKEAEFVLRQLAQETGGRSFFPNSVHELPKIYDLISQELSTLYSIGYTSRNPSRNGAWRRIVVRVARPGMLARTRQGYYGPTAP